MRSRHNIGPDPRSFDDYFRGAPKRVRRWTPFLLSFVAFVALGILKYVDRSELFLPYAVRSNLNGALFGAAVAMVVCLAYQLFTDRP